MTEVERPTMDAMYARAVDTSHAILDKLDQLFAAARPEAVFAAPVSAEGKTVIGTSEVLAWVALGGGGGGAMSSPEPNVQTSGEAEGRRAAGGEGIGSGVGAGGSVHTRPVAVVVIDASGVRVQPVVDVTKFMLAVATTVGSVFFLIARMQRATKSLEGK